MAGLKAMEIKAYSTRPKAIARYRDLSVAALEAKAAAKARWRPALTGFQRP